MLQIGDKTRSFYINTAALFLLQIANYVAPLIVTPYLTRVLGIDMYGVVAFGLSLVQVACVITDFGFNLSATYGIAKNRENRDYVNQLLSSVFICKFFILLFVLFCCSVYIIMQQKYVTSHVFLFLMFLSIGGITFQPIWFFQGLEKMKYITIYTIGARILYFLLVILLVKRPEDLNWVAVSNGLSTIFAAILGIMLVYKGGYSFSKVNIPFVKAVFLDSNSYFWSRMAVAMYTSVGTLFLGIFSNTIQTAYYASAEQLYKAGQSFLNPINQALYPYMAKEKNFKHFFKVLKFVIIGSIIGGIIAFFISKKFIVLFFGQSFAGSYNVFRIYIIVFLITCPAILLGYPFLGALNRNDLANKSVLFAGAIQIVLLVLLAIFRLTSAIHVVMAVLIVESIVLCTRWYYAVKTYRIQIKEIKKIG